MNLPFSRSGIDTPVGTIIAYAGIIDESEPKNKTGTINNIQAYGWVVCDGRELLCNQYPELFQALGFLYSLKGEPTDSNADLPANQTFRVPDYRGYFLRGNSGDSGNDPDADERKFANGDKVTTGENKTGSIQEDKLQTHQHQYLKEIASSVTAGPVGSATLITGDETKLTSEPTNEVNSTPGDIRVSSETRPKNFYVNYLMKFAYL